MQKSDTDKSRIKLIMDEPWKTFQARQVVKYPCGHGGIEISGYGDKYLECPECHKKFLMINNQHGTKKIYSK